MWFYNFLYVLLLIIMTPKHYVYNFKQLRYSWQTLPCFILLFCSMFNLLHFYLKAQVVSAFEQSLANMNSRHFIIYFIFYPETVFQEKRNWKNYVIVASANASLIIFKYTKISLNIFTFSIFKKSKSGENLL